jgi:hypothetical protein
MVAVVVYEERVLGDVKLTVAMTRVRYIAFMQNAL